MSEASLRRLLERLGSDAGFVEALKQNPEQALGEYELSQTERVALATNDEDGLRRLAGLDVASFMLSGTLQVGAAGTVLWLCDTNPAACNTAPTCAARLKP